ncbi:MAG: hypothetical protein M1281_13415 [Chloroflexi bacterium]|nr:hypothetical protein [Chloroflexota bacterium]
MRKSGMDLVIVLWWLLSAIIAVLLLGPLIGLISNLPGINVDQLGAFTIPLAYALIAGTLQWLILRTRIKKAGWWPLASLGGMGAGFLILFGLMAGLPQETAQSISSSLPEPVQGMLEWGIEAGALGLVQWLVLRKSLPRAGWWIAISLLGGLLLGLMVGVGVQTPSWEVYAIPLCMGLIPGLGLAGLFWSWENRRADTGVQAGT